MTNGTDFDQYDHAQLRDMVRSTDAATVVDRGVHLQAAGQVLKDLSAALKSHVDNVGWEGPAAESFRTWAGNLQKSAMLLGDYSTKAGDALLQAGESLSLAKAAVPEPPRAEIALLATAVSQRQGLPTTGTSKIGSPESSDYLARSSSPDWISNDRMAVADAIIKRERVEAVKQMVRLAQAYSGATATLNSLEDPNLPGTPDKDRVNSVDYSPGGTTQTAVPGAANRSPRVSTGSTAGTYSQGGGSYSRGSIGPRQLAPEWQAPEAAVHTGPVPSRVSGNVPLVEGVGTSTPSSVPSDPVNRPGTGLDSLLVDPTLSGQGSPVGAVGSGNVPFDGLGGFPGRSGESGESGGNPGLPIGGRVPVGGFPRNSGSAPIRGGGSIAGRSGGSASSRPVPFGGAALPGKTGTPGLPSGTVFGSREAQSGRAGTPGMPGVGGMHPGAMGHGSSGSGGGTRGRGLTSMPGGVVGGRKGPSAGGEFTPGGTGLYRRAGAGGGSGTAGQNGMMGPGVHGGGAGRNERDRRQRPDYLREDEETWTSDTPHSNPNVVE